MYRLLFLAFLLPLLIVQVHGQPQDTTFLERRLDSNGYRAVFIAGPNSTFHRLAIEAIRIDAREFSDWMFILFKDKTANFKVPEKYQGEWMSVFCHEGATVAYYASEPYTNSLVGISNHIVWVNDFNDGVIPLRVLGVRQAKDSIIYHLKDPYSAISHLTIRPHPQNPQLSYLRLSRYREKEWLGIRTSQYDQLPIIVTYCPNYRCEEYNFQEECR